MDENPVAEVRPTNEGEADREVAPWRSRRSPTKLVLATETAIDQNNA